MKKFLPLLFIPSLHAATLEWTGNGDGISFYQEANWEIQGGGAVTGNPLAPSVAITDDLIFTGVNPNISSQLTMAASANLQNSGGTIIMTNGGGMSGGTVSMTNSASTQTDWLNNTTINLTQSTLTLRGAANPLSNSTIAATGNAWTINFTNKTPAQVEAEHLSKITINGQAVALGTNCTLSPQGSTGSTLTPGGAPDNDNDGLSDTWETLHFNDLDETATGDPDGDNLNNLAEQTRKTNPTLSDTDGDGYNDGDETDTGTWVNATNTGTDPLSSDSDKDGLPDGVETNTGVFLNGGNTGTNPNLFNTDDDRVGDGAEVARGHNPTDPNDQPNLPNIIFIMADDLGYNHLSCYGQQRLATPHIDSLAAQGIRFTDAYAGSAVCGPSRSSLFSGTHSGHIPFKINSAYCNTTSRTPFFTEILKKSGYMVGGVGKWGTGGIGSGQTPSDRGFDYYLGMLDHGHGHRHFPSYLMENNVRVDIGNTTTGASGNTSSNPAHRVKHTHDAFTDGALDFIGNNHDKAFFCYMSFTLPHTEIIATDEVLATPEFAPANWPETYTANTSAHISQSQPRRNFGAELRMIDNSVGKVIAKLQDPNGDGDTSDSITNNTIVIFTSDNGGQLKSTWGSAPSVYFNANGILRAGKAYMYEGGLRVPMIVKWPNHITANTTSNLPTYFADFLPTVCDITNVAPPKHTDGLSILPTWKGNTAQQKIHPFLYWAHQTSRVEHAVRIGKWKAVKLGNNAIELYNLDTDPSETSNVAGANLDIVNKAQAIMTREYVPELNEPKASANSPVYPNN